MLNILVVNENFTGGGLETHIHSYYMELREKHHFVFAFGNFKSKLEFEKADVYTGFHFGWRCSIGEFIDDVERLLQLIQEKKIDVIHAHPFHSIFPAVIAGQLAGVPVACTHHGAYSFAFPGGVNEALLLYYAYTELVSCVFSVSNTEKKALEERAHVPNVVFMPNAIDSRLYRRHTIANNRRWAAISRLDEDAGKTSALKKLFEAMPYLPIDGVDVYGDGSQRQALEEYVKKLGLADRVRFMGFQSDLWERLDGNYNGVIGSDRVALEGLTMGYPVLELGYDRICGVLYGELLQRAKERNFVANTLPELDSGAIAIQLEQAYAAPERFDFRQEIIAAFDIQSIAKAYIKQMSALAATPHANIVAWFEEVKEQPDRLANFYASQDIFYTIKRCIEPYAIDRNMKDLFILAGGGERLKSELGQLQVAQTEHLRLLEQAQAQVADLRKEEEAGQSRFLGLKDTQELLQTRTLTLEKASQQLQIQFSDLKSAQEGLGMQTSALEDARGQLQACISNLEEAQGQLQAQIIEMVGQLRVQVQEQFQTQERLLRQLQEQTEYHGKILAPLIWLRRLLSKIKWKIKGWLK